jgi:MFS family permease
LTQVLVSSEEPRVISDPDIGTRLTDRERRGVLWTLCLTEIVSWGVLYYAFAVLGHEIAADTGWSLARLTALFSLALVVSGAVGVYAGRVMHRHGPRWVMTAGSVLAAAALVIIATAPNLMVFAAGWILAGAAMAGVLYAPAFAAITVWFGADRVRALTAVTLVAGLASTVFAPLTAALSDHLSWRETYLVLAAVLALLTVGPHAIFLRPVWPRSPDGQADPGAVAGRGATPRGFWSLTIAYTLMSICAYATIINLVPLLHERGYGATESAWALGIGGVGQVLGRLGYARLARRVGLVRRTVAIFGVSAICTGILALVDGPYVVVVAASLFAGYTRGLATLLGATAISDRWGIGDYARLNGIFSGPLMAAAAIAPFLGAGLALLPGGFPLAFGVLAAIGVIGTAIAAIERHSSL